MRAMAARFVADGKQDEARVFHFFDFASAMPSSGGLMKSSAELIYMTCAVDFLEARRGIVVARSIDLVQQIVGVQPGESRLEIIIQIFVRGVARRIAFSACIGARFQR